MSSPVMTVREHCRLFDLNQLTDIELTPLTRRELLSLLKKRALELEANLEGRKN